MVATASQWFLIRVFITVLDSDSSKNTTDIGGRNRISVVLDPHFLVCLGRPERREYDEILMALTVSQWSPFHVYLYSTVAAEKNTVRWWWAR